MDPICCRVLQSTSPTASVMVYLFQNPIWAPTSPAEWLSLPRFPTIKWTYFPVRLLTRLFRPCKDGLTMPAHVATKAKINPSTCHRSGRPGSPCDSLSVTWINPSLNHCAGGHPEPPCLSTLLLAAVLAAVLAVVLTAVLIAVLIAVLLLCLLLPCLLLLLLRCCCCCACCCCAC